MFPNITPKTYHANESLASYCHEGFTIARGKYLVKEEKIRKGIRGRNDSQCLLLLLLTFVFYKKLYFLIISMCLFLLLFSSFISAD